MKRMVILLGVFCLFLLQIGNTYAVFESDAMGESKVKTAKWVIRVNDGDLGKSQTFNIDNLAFIGNDLVKEGKFAPNTEGYFDIVIDPRGTEVSLVYTLSFDFSGIGNDMIRISDIRELGGNELIRTGENSYTGIMEYKDILKGSNDYIRVSFEWINDDTNNSNDMESMLESKFGIPVLINVKQYLGEDIISYNG